MSRARIPLVAGRVGKNGAAHATQRTDTVDRGFAYCCGPADANFIALVGSEVVEDEPGCCPEGMGVGRELGGQPRPEGPVDRGEGVEVKAREKRLGGRDGDGLGAEEYGLFGVGEDWGKEDE